MKERLCTLRVHSKWRLNNLIKLSLFDIYNINDKSILEHNFIKPIWIKN